MAYDLQKTLKEFIRSLFLVGQVKFIIRINIYFCAFTGVQKALISKIENDTKDIRLSTIMKVFNALKAKLKMTIDFDANSHLEIA